jgi:hypothetical protein
MPSQTKYLPPVTSVGLECYFENGLLYLRAVSVLRASSLNEISLVPVIFINLNSIST